MSTPYVQRFGYGPNSVLNVGIVLRDFTRSIQANWDDAAREAEPELLNQQGETITEHLLAARLSARAQTRLVELSMSGQLAGFQSIGEQLTAPQADTLREQLPFQDKNVLEVHKQWLSEIVGTPAFAALEALHLILVDSNYWPLRGELAVRMATGLETLGLRGDSFAGKWPMRIQHTAFDNELAKLYPAELADHYLHPLDVLARLFQPGYVEKLAEYELVELPESTA